MVKAKVYLKIIFPSLYEALARGLPVTDDTVGRLVRVKEQVNRIDNYYWATSIVDKESICEQMKFFGNHQELLKKFKQNAREKALNECTWIKRKDELNQFFENVVRMDNMPLDQLKKRNRVELEKTN